MSPVQVLHEEVSCRAVRMSPLIAGLPVHDQDELIVYDDPSSDQAPFPDIDGGSEDPGFREFDDDEDFVPVIQSYEAESKELWSDGFNGLRRMLLDSGVTCTQGTAFLKYLSDRYPQDNYLSTHLADPHEDTQGED